MEPPVPGAGRARRPVMHVRGLVRATVLYMRTDMGYVSHATLMPFPLVSQRAPRRKRVRPEARP